MTLDQCRATLIAIRKRQGTQWPSLRVLCDGQIHRGRLVRSDTDGERPRDAGSPFGTLTLEPLGMAYRPETILQIASIQEQGIQDLQAQSSAVEQPVCSASR